MNNSYQIHAVAPPAYLLKHHGSLLPDWPYPPQQLLLIFFKARYPLLGSKIEIQTEKERLGQEFQTLSSQIEELAVTQFLKSEAICPKSGYPLGSRPGTQGFDLVAIAVATLKFETVAEGDCKVLKHPDWHHACYPGLILLWGDGKDVKIFTDAVGSKSRGIIGDCRFNPI